MKERTFLTLGMSLLFIVIIVSFSLLIFYKKDSPFLLNVAEEKIMDYIEEEYKYENNNFKYSKVTYNKKDKSYEMVITDKSTKKSFTISLKNKKINDSYKKEFD